jgi:putative toxin-antitoxin system antitoxin component (TIGR02293 family)
VSTDFIEITDSALSSEASLWGVSSPAIIEHVVRTVASRRPQITEPAPIIEAVYRKLGGRRVLGREVASEADLAHLVQAGIPEQAVAAVQGHSFSDREIERFVIPARTRRHRRQRKQPLTLEESDRLVRRVQALAEDVFGGPEKAGQWLRQGLEILNGQAPLELARTEAAAKMPWRWFRSACRPCG